MRTNHCIFRAQQLAISSQGSSEEEKENSPSKGRGLLFKRKAARRSKSLSKDHWEEVIFCEFLFLDFSIFRNVYKYRKSIQFI